MKRGTFLKTIASAAGLVLVSPFVGSAKENSDVQVIPTVAEGKTFEIDMSKRVLIDFNGSSEVLVKWNKCTFVIKNANAPFVYTPQGEGFVALFGTKIPRPKMVEVTNCTFIHTKK